MFQIKTISIHLGIVFLAVGAMSWLFSRRRRWQPVGKLTNIYIYPIKSGRWKEIAEAECTTIGLKYIPGEDKVSLRDRVFVVYSKENMTFVHGRTYPKMIFITVEPKSSNSVIFSYPEKPDLEVILPSKFDGNYITVWSSEKVPFVDCGDEIAKWISEVIRGETEGFRVGYWPESESFRRDVESIRTEEMNIFKNLSNKFTGAYSDLSSFLLINTSSVNELNQRIGEVGKCSELNFRPNFVIEGAEAFAEDKWDWIKIGDAVFRNFRPCTRCTFTTIDPNTAIRNEENEPLKTLKTYRTMKMLGESRVQPNTPVIGIYIGLQEPATIKTGDTVYISS